MLHRIRLRRPWTRTVTVLTLGESLTSAIEASQTVDVPDAECRVGPGGDAPPVAEVTYRRRFNRPSGLNTDDQTWIELQSWTGQLLRLQLNETILTVDPQPCGEQARRVDVSDSLQPHNELIIQLRDNAAAARLTGAVNLCIEPR